MKNDFYFILKAVLVLKLFFKKNGLIRELRLISKFMTLKSEKQINAIHILLNILRSKSTQRMKFVS